MIEISYILIAIWLWQSSPARLGFYASMLLLAYFGLVVIIDMEHRLILHQVSVIGAVLGFLIGTYLHGWISTLLGGVVGFTSMLVLYWFGEWLLRKFSRNRTEEDVALGFGDVNLTGVLGLILGLAWHCGWIIHRDPCRRCGEPGLSGGDAHPEKVPFILCAALWTIFNRRCYIAPVLQSCSCSLFPLIHLHLKRFSPHPFNSAVSRRRIWVLIVKPYKTVRQG